VFFSCATVKVKDLSSNLKLSYFRGSLQYHKDNTCPRLKSNFLNFEIPIEITEKGENEVKRFRTWFNENKNLMETDLKRFIELLQARFFITREINPKSIDHSNSGTEEVKRTPNKMYKTWLGFSVNL
jgi:hypothetical protein